MLIVCPHCHSLNRVPPERVANDPQCGSCHRALLSGEPLELSDADFERFVSKNELPAIADFWAPRVRTLPPDGAAVRASRQTAQGPCLAGESQLHDQPRATARHRIRSIPTLLLFRGGHEAKRQPGVIPAQELVRWAGA